MSMPASLTCSFTAVFTVKHCRGRALNCYFCPCICRFMWRPLAHRSTPKLTNVLSFSHSSREGLIATLDTNGQNLPKSWQGVKFGARPLMTGRTAKRWPMMAVFLSTVTQPRWRQQFSFLPTWSTRALHRTQEFWYKHPALLYGSHCGAPHSAQAASYYQAANSS